MEPVAVNHITVTRDLFAESHEAIFSVRRQKMLLYGGLVFLLFGLILLAFQSRIPNAPALFIPLLLTGAAVVLWSLTLKKSDLKKQFRSFQRKNGDDPQRTVICSRTGVEVDTGKEKPVRIEYTDVREWRETPHLYLLLCSNHMGVQLAKDGFETGSWDQVLQAMDKAKKDAAAMMELM